MINITCHALLAFIISYLVLESLIFWISSIKAFATDGKGGSAPILIVGTHIDTLKEEAKLRDIDIDHLIDEKFNKIREVLKMSDRLSA